MRAEGWSRWLLGGLATLLVALGIAAAGGLGTGRAERRDEVRGDDLRLIHGALACRSAAGAEAPDALGALAPVPGCASSGRLADPFTGAPYGYERLGADLVRLCALFEEPVLVTELSYGDGAFDPATGCEAIDLRPEDERAEGAAPAVAVPG